MHDDCGQTSNVIQGQQAVGQVLHNSSCSQQALQPECLQCPPQLVLISLLLPHLYRPAEMLTPWL